MKKVLIGLFVLGMILGCVSAVKADLTPNASWKNAKIENIDVKAKVEAVNANIDNKVENLMTPVTTPSKAQIVVQKVVDDDMDNQIARALVKEKLGR